ncbi:unnamed protein product [Polarella glacialis]|uniref:DUF1445 domain-containing protein n=1 Tax=Polarella glacialis TaxID=89957 RepID=A0A813K1Z1_POLGL|nr:unnamed protein product [Polarella glacialis]
MLRAAVPCRRFVTPSAPLGRAVEARSTPVRVRAVAAGCLRTPGCSRSLFGGRGAAVLRAAPCCRAAFSTTGKDRSCQPPFGSAQSLREACRSGSFAFPTAGHAAGHVQANLVILPKSYADDFRRFCANNAAACPLLEFTEPGIFEAVKLAPGSDLRKDLPKYHVWKHGLMAEERTDVTDLWQDDMQAFLLGCSFTWEDLLGAVQLTPRHVQENRNVPMFNTNIKLKGAGPFQGHMVVSMRPYKPGEVGRVADITGEYPAAHGRPVQIGEPAAIGINDVRTPDYGQSVTVQEGEVPVFWACGVTPQNALRNAKLPLVITHAPGHMLVADTLNEELKSWRVPGVWSARPDAE